MKTIEDLKNVYDAVVDGLLVEYGQIGGEYAGERNSYEYIDDGWYVRVEYTCYGEWWVDDGDRWTPPDAGLTRAWGDVTEVVAAYCDEETGEDVEFDQRDLEELRLMLEDELNRQLCNMSER